MKSCLFQTSLALLEGLTGDRRLRLFTGLAAASGPAAEMLWLQVAWASSLLMEEGFGTKLTLLKSCQEKTLLPLL